jgi:peptidoglycan hydrolase-like protein with peptidoglycan-binding domain
MACISRTLQLGSTGSDVGLLEQKLKSLGYYTGAIDNKFGPYLKQATILYQKAEKLDQDGVDGPVTLGKLGLWCNKPNPTPVPSNVGPIQKQIQSKTGKTFKSFTEFYNLVVKYCNYSHYFNDQKSLQTEINNLIAAFNGKPTGNEDNCVDYAQVGVALAHEMGYGAIPYGIYCKVDKINHAIFWISGKEFGSGTWIDLAAAASDNYVLGRHWCSGDPEREPKWIPYEG